MAFTFKKLSIPDVVLVEPDTYSDTRGFFLEVFKRSAFREAGIDMPVVQVNQSRSVKDIVRGLHYQVKPAAQAKYIQVVVGTIFDVAVDIRENSPTFGQWVGAELSDENKRMMFIPEGFAHGFCVTSAIAEVMYCCSREYSRDHERGIIWNDPAIGIDWPVNEPTLSDKDRTLPTLKNAEKNF